MSRNRKSPRNRKSSSTKIVSISEPRPETPKTVERGSPDAASPGSPNRSRWPLLALFTLILVSYPNVVFFSDSLVGSANYPVFDYRFDHMGYEEVRGTPFMNWHDLGATWWQWEPGGQFFSRAYREGDVPLWDPTSAAGTDAHTNVTQGQYFPPYILLLLAGNTPLLRDIYHLSLALISGLFCLRLLQRNGFHDIAAVSMAAMWMLGGALTLTINSLLGQTYAMIPMVVLVADGFLDRPSWRRGGAVGLAVGLLTLAAFLPAAISGLLLLPLLLGATLVARTRLFRDTATEPESGRPVAASLAFAGFSMIGLSLAAFLLLPVHLASQNSSTFAPWYVGTGLHHYPVERLITLVSPRIAFDVWQIQDPSRHVLPGDPMSFSWVGLCALLLIVLAPSRLNGGKARMLLFFASAALIIALKLIGLPPFQWIGHLPVLEKIHFIPYFNGALNFALAGLAAIGLDNVIRERPSKWRIASVAGSLVAIGVLYGLLLGRYRINPGADTVRLHLELSKLLLVGGGLVVVLCLRRTRLSGRQAGMAILALICIDLVPGVLRDRLNRYDPWKDPPRYVSFLRSDRSLFRIHSIRDIALTPNVPQGLGLHALGSRQTFNPPRVDRFLRTFFETQHLPYPKIESLVPEPRWILDLLNVKYLIAYLPTPAEIASLEAAGLSEVFVDGSYHVLRNRRVWPRAWMARSVLHVPNAEAALEAVATIKVGAVVIEGQERVPTPLAGGRVSVVRYTPDRIELRAESTGPGIVVLSDSIADGWTASVNGRQATLLPANYAFRAVRVPAGISTVRFEYRTPGLRAGIWFSAASLLLILVFLAVPRPLSGSAAETA